jgi:murein L,D-transpeptidase YcbB/YkuD
VALGPATGFAEAPNDMPPDDTSTASCTTPTQQRPPAQVTAPAWTSVAGKDRGARNAKPTQASKAKWQTQGGSALSDDPTPSVAPETSGCTAAAAKRYADIADHGGWPNIAKPLRPGATSGEIAVLRQRLAIEGDLDAASSLAVGNAPWDSRLTQAVKRYQFRLGLRQTGAVDEATLKALNVSASNRARALAASDLRLKDLQNPPFDERYVVVNIPAATVEAVESGRVVHRYTAVVGGKDHQSPEIAAKITEIILNPTWTLPASIIKNEVIPKMAKNPRYLSRMHIRILDRRGRSVNSHQIDWASNEATEYTLRQISGRKNSLGTLKIDMPNKDAVYMHDTPAKAHFAEDYRFLSHGCVRVDGVYDLAAWLLAGAKRSRDHAWDVAALEHAAAAGDKQTIKLKQRVPVLWVYLDSWADADGTVHFRDDTYGLDESQPGLPSSQAK